MGRTYDASTRPSVDGFCDDVVDAELDEIAQSLSGDQARSGPTGTRPSPSGDPHVVTLTVDLARAPVQPALAPPRWHKNLAPWVEAIEITVGDEPVLMVARRGLAPDELVDANELRAHTIGAPEWLTAVAPSIDGDTVLTCSARTPL